MKLAPALAALGLGLLALAGCGGSQNTTTTLGPQAIAVEDGTASDAIVQQLLDAANQALVFHATGGSLDQVTTTNALHDPVPGGMAKVDLPALAGFTMTVSFAGLKDSADNERFPNCTGKFSVLSTGGDVVTSWPTGSAAMASFPIIINFDQGDVTYTDPNSGAVTTIPNGSISLNYTLETSTSYTSSHNWVLQLDSTHKVASGTPLTMTVARTGQPTHTLSVFGARDTHLTLTRADNTTGTGTTNTYAVFEKVNGLNADGTTVDGVSGVDTGNPVLTFTNWDVTIDGSTHVVWNRNAQFTYHYDFIAGGGAITDPTPTDEIFITINGATKLGPYTAAGLIALFHATPK